MSERLKFRAWNVATRTMVDLRKITPLVLNADVSGIFIPDSDGIIVMQWSGLHDKNGKEIYEGDYLRCGQYIGGNFIDYCYELGYVEFVHGAFGLHRKQGFYRPFKDWLEGYEYEVLGNIHEHPELLNQRD